MGKHSTDRSLRRRQILDQCRTDSELDAWMLDHFPDTKQLVTASMDRLAKVTLLLEREDLEQIDAALSLTPPLLVQTPKSGDGPQPAAPWPKRSLWLGAGVLTGGVALLLSGSASYRNPRPTAALAGCVSDALLPCLGQNYLLSLNANDAWQVPLSAASRCKRSWIEWIRTISQECIKKDILGIRYRLVDIDELHDDDSIKFLRDRCETKDDVMACIKAGTMLRKKRTYQTDKDDQIDDEVGKLFVRACENSADNLARCSPLFVEQDLYRWLNTQWQNSNKHKSLKLISDLCQNCKDLGDQDCCRKNVLEELCDGFQTTPGSHAQMPAACVALSELYRIKRLPGYTWDEAMDAAEKGCDLARHRDASCHHSDPQYSECDDAGITSCHHVMRLCEPREQPKTEGAAEKCSLARISAYTNRWKALCPESSPVAACKN